MPILMNLGLFLGSKIRESNNWGTRSLPKTLNETNIWPFILTKLVKVPKYGVVDIYGGEIHGVKA